MKLQKTQNWCFVLLLYFSDAYATPAQICVDGFCDVLSVSSQARIATDDAQLNRNGNVVVVEPGVTSSVAQLDCRVSAAVPEAAWAGLHAMMESVGAQARPPSDLNNAQQVMILFYSSLQDMLKEFSCDRAAAQMH